mgnify:CR=1 FL=1
MEAVLEQGREGQLLQLASYEDAPVDNDGELHAIVDVTSNGEPAGKLTASPRPACPCRSLGREAAGTAAPQAPR